MAENETIRQAGGDSEGAYRAFLLRCWQEPGAGPGGRPAWRFTLVKVEGGVVQKGFASLEGVVQATPTGNYTQA